ncbi:MAG: endolytic transglycosylase MltG [Desulfovibrio sp.]|nr:endolytic transglycosylase MltG [Desulfovibrio sp.]
MRRAYILLALLLLVLLAGTLSGVVFLTSVPEQSARPLVIDVPQGARLTTIAEKLEAEHAITNAKLFCLLARITQNQGKLQTGRFALTTAMRPYEVLHTLVHGKPVLYRITIPEGLPWWKVAALLSENGFVWKEAFHAVITDPAFLKAMGIPFPSCEGFLMPDTYLLKKEEQILKEAENDPANTLSSDELRQKHARTIATRLVGNFWKRAKEIVPDIKTNAQQSKRLVILASIVEKETAIPSERARIAGVYTNRLRKHMLLQADPTVIYGLGSTFTGKLLYRHLDAKNNPYNTYQLPGLPPGPICSFGMEALRAAANPEAHDYLYFVAKGQGGEHVFSKDLKDHQKAVRDYRKSQRAQ